MPVSVRRTPAEERSTPPFLHLDIGEICSLLRLEVDAVRESVVEGAYETINRSIFPALPVFSSHSTTTAHKRTSPAAGWDPTGIPFRNLPTTSSFLTPITPSYGPLIPTSVM